MCCRPQKPFWDDIPVEKSYEDAEINEHGYISVCFSLRLLYFTMAAVNRRDISKAGYQAVLTELKRHWHERGQCPFTVSVETCNTVSFFSSLKSSSISHNTTSPWVTELIHSCTGEKGGRSAFQWLLWALFPVPQPLFLTKTWQTLSLQGMKGRVTFLCHSWYAHLCVLSAVGGSTCLCYCFLYLTMNCRV